MSVRPVPLCHRSRQAIIFSSSSVGSSAAGCEPCMLLATVGDYWNRTLFNLVIEGHASGLFSLPVGLQLEPQGRHFHPFMLCVQT